MRQINQSDKPVNRPLSRSRHFGFETRLDGHQSIAVAYLSVIITNVNIVVKTYPTLIFRGMSRNESARHLYHTHTSTLFMTVQLRFISKNGGCEIRVYAQTSYWNVQRGTKYVTSVSIHRATPGGIPCNQSHRVIGETSGGYLIYDTI